jgi:hypothetical protein
MNEETMTEDKKRFEEKIKRFDRIIIHYLITILVSMLTTLFILKTVLGK